MQAVIDKYFQEIESGLSDDILSFERLRDKRAAMVDDFKKTHITVEFIESHKQKLDNLKVQKKETEEAIANIKRSIRQLQTRMLIAVRPELSEDPELKERFDITHASVFSVMRRCQDIKPVSLIDRVTRNDKYKEHKLLKRVLRILEEVDEEAHTTRIQLSSTLESQENRLRCLDEQMELEISKILKVDDFSGDADYSVLSPEFGNRIREIDNEIQGINYRIFVARGILDMKEKMLEIYREMPHIVGDSEDIIETLKLAVMQSPTHVI